MEALSFALQVCWFPFIFPFSKIILVRMAEKMNFLIGAEAMFADLGHFSQLSIRVSFHSSFMSMAKFHDYVCACMLGSCFVVILFV